MRSLRRLVFEAIVQRQRKRNHVPREVLFGAGNAGVAAKEIASRPDIHAVKFDVPGSSHASQYPSGNDLRNREARYGGRPCLSTTYPIDRFKSDRTKAIGMKGVPAQILVRIVADLIILNSASMLALLPLLVLGNCGLVAAFRMWLPMGGTLSVCGPLLFYAMGFYTRGRSYASKYKVLVVMQAATMLFLVLGLALYFFGLQPAFPHRSFLLAWMFCTAFLLAARLWAQVWRKMVMEEIRPHVSVEKERQSVLVIGGAGYIGSSLLPKLLDHGYHVRLLDCFLYGEDPIRPVQQHPALEIHRGDFRNTDAVVAAMRDMKSVIHLGGLVGDPACALDEELTIQVNLVATRMIAQVAKGNGISRFVFASSCSVYGTSDLLLNERSALHPVSLYARSKVASEKVLLGMRNDGFEPVILRFGTIHGLSGRTRFDLVVNLLTAKAVVDGVITVFGKDQWRPFLHVHDAAQAVLLALKARSDSIASPIFNVGSNDQNRTLGQVGELIQSMVPGSYIVTKEEGVDRRNYRVEFRRIQERLNFCRSMTLEAGIEQVLEAIRSGKVRNYQDPKYSNVHSLSKPEVRQALPVMEDLVTKFRQAPMGNYWAAQAGFGHAEDAA
jgi:nucleoside-diphosphate-sugar epimerase